MQITSMGRRMFLGQLGLAAMAQQLVLTPAQTEGPYYPDKLPLDQDNDLIISADSITPAVGSITWLSGQVLDKNGNPVRNALVEIWQADNNGAYLNTRSPITNRDANFQGYGKFLTGSTGEYLFRTVKPGLYPGRTRHIHYAIHMPNGDKLTTQCYVAGDALNASDGVLNGISNLAQRNSVIVPFTAIPESKIGELAAKFDIVMGFTPPDPVAGKPSILATAGVVNGAGFQAGLTPGAWVSIFGDNLATRSRAWDATTEIVNGQLPVSLDGVSVTIDGKAAAIYSIGPNQINVQVPDGGAAGPVTVTVKNALGVSDPVTATLAGAQPGLFLFANRNVAAVRSDGVLIGPSGLIANTLTVPARPGDAVLLFGTGFGDTETPVASGQVVRSAVRLRNTVSVRIGQVAAPVDYAGLTSAGLNQLNVRIPDLPDGDHDVVATVAGVKTQPLARIRVAR